MKQKLEHLIHRGVADIQRFSDPRFVGQVIFVIIVLLVSYSGIKSIQTNYTLQKQIGALKQQNDLKRLENDNLKLQNNYYNSAQYLELAARQNFPLAAPGEKEITVPDSVAVSYVASLPDDSPSNEVVTKPAIKESNLQSWVNFFLHRNTN